MTIPSHPHDAFFKAFLKDPENLRQFLKDFLPKKLLKFLNLEHLQILPEEKIPLSKKKRLIPDLVVETSLLDRTLHIYLLIEHKSQPDIKTFLQIGFYILSLHEEDLKAGRRLTPVFPLVYYHGKVAWGLPRHYLELFDLPEEIRPLFLDFVLEVVDLSKIEDEALLKGLELYGFLYGFLWLQKNVGRATLEEIVYVLERIISLWGLMNERGRILFGFMVRYISVVKGVDEREVVYKIMERGGERVEREIRTFWDDIREEALREGLQQGLRQGLLAAQEMVLEALEERFGKVEEELSERIKRIEDRDFLKRLFRLSLKVNSIDEILQELELKRQ